MERGKILICDDDQVLAQILSDELRAENFNIVITNSGKDAIEELKINYYDVLLLDLNLPDIKGSEVLKFSTANFPFTQVIMLTGTSDISDAVECMKLGAYDFITKPYDFNELLQVIFKAIEKKNLITNNIVLSKELNQLLGFEIIGESKLFKELLALASRAAQSDSPILIQGETGTGKEVLAKYIHSISPRSSKPIVTLNCASLPDTLFESELFGHEKGSFTDAKQTKPGLVEIANEGSLFLDEIGELSLIIQPKLLRFLETGEFRRVGGLNNRKSNVRLIAATNKNLVNEVKEKRFREDLLFRLNVIPLTIPPLRKRKEDIIPLAEYFLKQKNKTRKPKILSDEAKEFLLNYNFPGNVRELEHLIERSLIFCDGEVIYPKHFNLMMSPIYSVSEVEEEINRTTGKPFHELSAEELEKIHIKSVLDANNWNREQSARVLGISLKTLYTKIKKYNLQ
ncbi:MAG: sigma-54 dependent transcriptional regulator [Ignavibacteria bacterium]|nr:sigma-54 dependent transcriptional regulator [Ignavibacteria bacterium]MDH7527009.1 sigma-54 dependent transcriptional regulator [Ignavibacteria bacterium]